MKSTLIVLASLFTLSAFAAPTTKKDLGVFGVWRAAEIEGHAFWNKNVCLAWAQTTDGKSTLEIYAEEFGAPAEGYTSPTIQVIPDPRTPRFICAVATANGIATEFHLTLESTPANPPAFGLLARIDQRAQLIDAIKKAGTLTVKLAGEKNVLVKTLTFSLRGSSKAVDAFVNGCKLTLD